MSKQSRIKLVWMAYLATPLRIQVCEELQEYLDAKFLFFDKTGTRPSWWEYPLTKNCKILNNVLFKKSYKYLTISHIKILNNFNPDVVVIPGFTTPTNLLTYCWCKLKKKKVVVFTERLRDQNGQLRKYSGVWKLIKYFYRNLDLIMVASKDAVSQLKTEFKFGDKVIASSYGFTIDDYLKHKPRIINKSSIGLIFPNRLIDIYNPILAIEIFNVLVKEYPDMKLSMNAAGYLRSNCESRIAELNIQQKVIFLDEINNWNDLSDIYSKQDIMILPANFSNGNFTIYEAMASGMGIVISNKVLGNGVEIVNGKNGFNLSPDIISFVNSIKLYIENPSLLTKHSKINKDICKKYSVEETAKLYFNQLSTLFSDSN